MLPFVRTRPISLYTLDRKPQSMLGPGAKPGEPGKRRNGALEQRRRSTSSHPPCAKAEAKLKISRLLHRSHRTDPFQTHLVTRLRL